MLPLELPLIVGDRTEALETAQHAAQSFAIAYQMADDLDDFAQDRTSGSLNSVSALVSTGCSLEEARSIVRYRAVELLNLAIEVGSRLPQNCAAVMLDHAETAVSLDGDHSAVAKMKRNGKSFWFASLFLPRETAADAATLYQFCRVLDDIADGEKTSEKDRA